MCWNHPEPSLSTSLQGKQGVQGAYALVRTFSNHIITVPTASGGDDDCWMVFVTGEGRCAGYLCTSSVQSNHPELNVTKL